MELKKINYRDLPNREEILGFYNEIKDYLFPNYFHEVTDKDELLKSSKEKFKLYICTNNEFMEMFYCKLNDLYNTLLKDIEWTYESDPACNSLEEALITYPGIYSIISYRIAHLLYSLGYKIEARIITEDAHSKTGIDINPGATIGDYFFIDHGTGVVIGETTTIGHHCKIYQGVTLGAKTIKDARAMTGVKRHPTIGNYVTIYANASILGGDITIGDNSIIGSNVYVQKSIGKNCKVIYKEDSVTLIKE